MESKEEVMRVVLCGRSADERESALVSSETKKKRKTASYAVRAERRMRRPLQHTEGDEERETVGQVNVLGCREAVPAWVDGEGWLGDGTATGSYHSC